jgi:hypothetical protein
MGNVCLNSPDERGTNYDVTQVPSDARATARGNTRSDVETASGSSQTGSETSLKMFLQKNPKLQSVKEARDSRGGIFKLIDVAIFGFLLFSPALPIIPTMKQPAVVLVLWVLICLIMWCKIEYNHRAEVWHFCLYRGIILDFPKTNTLSGWLCQKPTLMAVTFLLVFGVVTYVGYDPTFQFDNIDYMVAAILAIVGLSFVLLLTKAYVDVEGAPQLLTVNLFVYLFDDPEMLSSKGFKVVHFTNLQVFVNSKYKTGEKNFSWDEVHALSHEPSEGESVSLIGGTRMFIFLNKFKDSDQ